MLTRQGVPAPGGSGPAPVDRGGYVARDGDDVVVVATGSELGTSLAAAEILSDRGVSARVVSMPCVEAFMDQDAGYQAEVLGSDLPVASVEAGVTMGWQAITGRDGLNIGVDRFGASAPAPVLAEEYGLTAEAIADRIAAWLEARG